MGTEKAEATTASANSEPRKSIPKRPPPAYQNYASDYIAEEGYSLAELNERGLYWTLKNYCWVNGSISADFERMGKLLSLPRDVVETAFGPFVKKHIVPMPDDHSRLYCPELERQRQENADYRRKLSDGGRNGGLKTQEHNRNQASRQASSPAKAPEMNGNEMQGKAVYRESPSPENKEWLEEFEGQAGFERK